MLLEKLQVLNQTVQSVLALMVLFGTVGSSINLIMRRIPEETFKKIEGSHPLMKSLLRITRKIFIDLWPAVEEFKKAYNAVKEARNNVRPPASPQSGENNVETNNNEIERNTESPTNTSDEK